MYIIVVFPQPDFPTTERNSPSYTLKEIDFKPLNLTGLRNNMKNQLMTMFDKITLRKRSVIETINDQLKNICQVEHSRHRSFANFLGNLISGILAYSFFPKKPRIKYETKNTFGQLAIC